MRACVGEGALDLLLQLYKSTVLTPKSDQRHPGIKLSPRWLTEAGEVDFGALCPLIERLGEVEVAILERRRERAAKESKPKNQTQCGFFARQGYCREGESCPFLHGSECPLDVKNAAVEAELRSKLRAFAHGGGDGELGMGIGMNSYQRRVCHKIADEYQLGHESRGDGQARQIYVWRLAVNAQPSSTTSDHSGGSSMVLSAKAGQQEQQVQQQERAAGMVKEAFDSALRAAIELAEEEEAKALDDGLVLGQGDDWCSDYYRVKFGRPRPDPSESEGSTRCAPPEGLIHEYLQGLQWVLRYYYNGVPSWSWFFPFHYAPTATDLGRTLRSRPGQPTGSYTPAALPMSTPLDPLSQLMGVLPAASATSLPAVCQELMSADSSPLIDFYPVEFALDPNGARMRWQWIALLPFIEEERLRRVVRERVLPKLSKEEQARNSKGVALLFAHRESALGKVLVSKLGDRSPSHSDSASKAKHQLEEIASGRPNELPLPGQVWLPRRRVSKALASLKSGQMVAAAGYALHTPSRSARTIGVQQGAIPPPSVLRTTSAGERRGPRPRMLLVDLQARKRQKQQQDEAGGAAEAARSSPPSVTAGAIDDERRGGSHAGRGGRGSGNTRGRGRGDRGRGGMADRGRGRGRGMGDVTHRVPLVAGETGGTVCSTEGQQQGQQLFVLDRVGTGSQHRDAVDPASASKGGGSETKAHKKRRASSPGMPHRDTGGPHNGSAQQKRQRQNETPTAPTKGPTKNGSKKKKKEKKETKKKKKKEEEKKKDKNSKGGKDRAEQKKREAADVGAQLFVIDRAGAQL